MPHESVWMDTSSKTSFPKLEDDISTDVVVIGGGIAGITTAYMLDQKGIDTVLLEKDRLVEKVSGHTTAKITALQGTTYSKLESALGAEKAESYADANKWAVQKIEEIVKENNIDCSFKKSPAFTYALEKSSENKIQEEFHAADRAGLSVEKLDDTNLPFKAYSAIKMGDQAYFHPRKYLLGLTESASFETFENSRVTSVESGKKHVVSTESGSIEADHVVLATHFPLIDKGLYFARMTPQYSYAMLVRLEETCMNGMFINPGSSFRSIRPGPFNDSIIVGGEGHSTGHGSSSERYEKLENWIRNNFPVKSIDYKWSTQDYSTFDHIPYIGELPFSDNIHIATGFGGWGMTNGTIAGKIISETIAGEKPEWSGLYNPSRLEMKSTETLVKLVKRNLHTGKIFVNKRISIQTGKISSIEQGEADTLEIDGEKIAVYHDRNGEFHTVSAVCTHLGCILSWNDAEKTWDCSCHGSRFTYKGETIDGPAKENLEQKDLGQ